MSFNNKAKNKSQDKDYALSDKVVVVSSIFVFA
jgi:hypothetical protein